jgi:hypothetical protein
LKLIVVGKKENKDTKIRNEERKKERKKEIEKETKR